MPEVGVAARAAYLDTAKPKPGIGMFGDGIGAGLDEAGPAAAALELRIAVEQSFAAAAAAIEAVAAIVDEAAGEGRLGSRLAKHMISLFRQAVAPFRVGEVEPHCVGHGRFPPAALKR